MELRLESHREADLLRVAGRLDLVSSSTLKDAIRGRLAERRVHIILNLERVDFINSSGLGALISAMKDIRLSDGRLVLCGLTPYVDEIFEITGLKKVFDTYRTEAEALASFGVGDPSPVGAMSRH
ncbi:MAG: STAS domain-containing protein [candidate division Zixibacteria bacterium]|nr:STAS domain-containing protein [candidate division Zixibacteria bacterium]